MLHQTLTLSSFLSTPPLSPPPSSSSQQVNVEMEFVEQEKALKTSCWPEMNVKLTQQQEQQWFVTEEILGGNGTSSVFGDDSFVDEFLDFSKEEEKPEEFVEEERNWSCKEQNSKISSMVSVREAFESPLRTELFVPFQVDDLEDLEWVSHFVDGDDSFHEISFPCPAKTLTQIPKQNRSYSGPISGISSMKTSTLLPQIHAKRSRTKRLRKNRRIWSLGSPSFSVSSSSSSSSLSSSSDLSSQTSCLIFTKKTQTPEFLYFAGDPLEKKQRRKPLSETQRRCSHCGVQKTPQWRAGPLGSKTLCNACGVRYKSGRLLPEYRPACSPTFSSDVHSNSHRKVIEMRKKKEMARPEPEMAQTVHSF